MTIESNKNKLPKARLGKLTINELSIVDRPCMEPALVALMKNQVQKKDPTKVEKGMLHTTEVEGHVHAICVYEDGTFYVQYATMTGASNSHSHSFRFENGSLTILADSGHTHELADLASGTSALLVVDPDAVVVVAQRESPSTNTKSLQAPASKSTQPSQAARVATPQEQSTMKTDAEKIADLESQNATLLKQLGLILKFSATEHSLWKSLPADEAAAFLAKSVNDRAPMITEFEKAHAVEYTAEDGTVYTKSQSAMAKLHKMADDERRLRVDGEVAKRASEIFGNIAGTDEARTNVLKAIERETDGTKREAMLAVIKSAAAGFAKMSRTQGVGGVDPVLGDPLAAFNAGVKAYAEKHAIKDEGLALEKFLGTSEGLALKKSYDATRGYAGASS